LAATKAASRSSEKKNMHHADLDDETKEHLPTILQAKNNTFHCNRIKNIHIK
jgi:hypothetical protein